MDALILRQVLLKHTNNGNVPHSVSHYTTVYVQKSEGPLNKNYFVHKYINILLRVGQCRDIFTSSEQALGQ